jgi:hypothetical protein
LRGGTYFYHAGRSSGLRYRWRRGISQYLWILRHCLRRTSYRLDPSVAGPYIADKLNITVNNNFPDPLDEYLVTGSSSTDSALAIELTRDDFSGMAFSNTSLPLTAPSLVAFTSVRFAFFDGTLD